jgi:uncharacterized protein (DUF1501 family)
MSSPQSKLFTRREFLTMSAVAGTAAVLPSFVTHTIRAALGDEPAVKPGEPIPGFRDDRVLVLIQLGGGNDGLNALPPHGDDAYHRARPRLAIRGDDVLKVDEHYGFHTALKPLKSLYDDGALSVIHGVGYPNPNRSHFRSMEIWHTATDSDKFSRSGWVGRYFDNACSGAARKTAGVAVGPEPPQAFDGARGFGVAFEDADTFGWRAGPGGDTQEAFESLNRVDEHAKPPRDGAPTVDFLRHVTAGMVLASEQVQEAAGRPRRAPEYPNSRVARDLRTVATMIAGGLPTRIYHVAFTGFDTHVNQANQHANLLTQFAGAVAAFQQDLKRLGAAGRVLTVAFSEFGRRVGENYGRGTDHGTAGPMFLIGDRIRPGTHGKVPSLTDLDRGDLKFHTDFRSVYATILDDWLGITPTKVLGRRFPTLDLLRD